MKKKLFLLGSVLFLFLYTIFNFYSDALSYDPMSAISVQQHKIKEARGIVSTYNPAWTEDILEKNLFSPTRSGPKPPPPPLPPPPPPPPPPPRRPELSLRGIVQNASGEYIGYMEIDKAPAVPMRKGDKLEDIEVVDISDRKVVLQWRSEKITMSMERIKTIGSTGTVRGNNAGVLPTEPTYRSRRRLGTAPVNIAPPPTVPQNVAPPPDDAEQ